MPFVERRGNRQSWRLRSGVAGANAPAFVERGPSDSRKQWIASVAATNAPAFVERFPITPAGATSRLVSPELTLRPSLSVVGDGAAWAASKRVSPEPTKYLRHTGGGTGKARQNPNNPNQNPDSRSQGASQAASAAPTLRYGPAGDSAPRLRLKAAGMTERFPFGPSTRPEISLFPHKQPSLRIGPERSRARSGEADP